MDWAARTRGRALWAVPALLVLALLLLRAARPVSPPHAGAASGTEARPAEEAALRRVVSRNRGDAAAHGRLGQYYLRRGRPFEAIWELEETLALRPDMGEARAGLAAALEGVSLSEMAREQLQQPVSSPPGDRERRLALARLELRRGDAAAAGRALRGAGDELATAPDGLLVQGRVLQAQGDRAGAEAAYRRHLKQATSSAEGYYRLGRLLLEAGRPAEARAVFAAGRQVVPADARFPFYLGLACLAPPNPQLPTPNSQPPTSHSRARALFQEAARLAPRHALPLYQLGLLDGQEGRWEAAAGELNAAVEADPDGADAYRELARALARLKKHPYDAYYRGLYYSKVERPAEAVREFRVLANARPDSPEGPLLVSRMFIQTAQYAEAAAAIQPALRRFPRDPELYERLAALDKFRGSYGSVEQLCRQWRAALPKASEPDWLLGKLRVAQGRLDEGIRLYEQALATEPDRAEYQAFLSQALTQRAAPGDLPRALDLIDRALRKLPQDPAAHLQRATLLQRLGRVEEARDPMLRSLDLDPHQTAPYNSLVQIAAQLRRGAPARFFAQAVRQVEARSREEEQVMRRVWTAPQDAGAHLAAARFRRRTGDLVKAKAHLEQALELRPGWPEAAQELRRLNRVLEAL